MALLLGMDGQSHEIGPSGLTIGRDAANALVLALDSRSSRRHAQIEQVDRHWFLVDLQSRNGSYLNGRRVQRRKLVSGDRLRFGVSEFVFVDPQDPHATVADEDAEVSVPRLTERERQVLALLARGKTDQQIAEQLGIRLSTVRSHLDRIAQRTGKRRRTELTRLALDVGLLD